LGEAVARYEALRRTILEVVPEADQVPNVPSIALEQFARRELGE
jgi:hypothetical protein